MFAPSPNPYNKVEEPRSAGPAAAAPTPISHELTPAEEQMAIGILKGGNLNCLKLKPDELNLLQRSKSYPSVQSALKEGIVYRIKNGYDIPQQYLGLAREETKNSQEVQSALKEGIVYRIKNGYDIPQQCLGLAREETKNSQEVQSACKERILSRIKNGNDIPQQLLDLASEETKAWLHDPNNKEIQSVCKEGIISSIKFEYGDYHLLQELLDLANEETKAWLHDPNNQEVQSACKEGIFYRVKNDNDIPQQILDLANEETIQSACKEGIFYRIKNGYDIPQRILDLANEETKNSQEVQSALKEGIVYRIKNGYDIPQRILGLAREETKNSQEVQSACKEGIVYRIKNGHDIPQRILDLANEETKNSQEVQSVCKERILSRIKNGNDIPQRILDLANEETKAWLRDPNNQEVQSALKESILDYVINGYNAQKQLLDLASEETVQSACKEGIVYKVKFGDSIPRQILDLASEDTKAWLRDPNNHEVQSACKEGIVCSIKNAYSSISQQILDLASEDTKAWAMNVSAIKSELNINTKNVINLSNRDFNTYLNTLKSDEQFRAELAKGFPAGVGNDAYADLAREEYILGRMKDDLAKEEKGSHKYNRILKIIHDTELNGSVKFVISELYDMSPRLREYHIDKLIKKGIFHPNFNSIYGPYDNDKVIELAHSNPKLFEFVGRHADMITREDIDFLEEVYRLQPISDNDDNDLWKSEFANFLEFFTRVTRPTVDDKAIPNIHKEATIKYIKNFGMFWNTELYSIVVGVTRGIINMHITGAANELIKFGINPNMHPDAILLELKAKISNYTEDILANKIPSGIDTKLGDALFRSEFMPSSAWERESYDIPSMGKAALENYTLPPWLVTNTLQIGLKSRTKISDLTVEARKLSIMQNKENLTRVEVYREMISKMLETDDTEMMPQMVAALEDKIKGLRAQIAGKDINTYKTMLSGIAKAIDSNSKLLEQVQSIGADITSANLNSLMEVLKDITKDKEINTLLRIYALKLILKDNPGLIDNLNTIKDSKDIDEDIMRKLVDFVSHVLPHEFLDITSELSPRSKERINKLLLADGEKVVSVGGESKKVSYFEYILKDLDKVESGDSGTTSMDIKFTPVSGLGRMTVGNIGDACYTSQAAQLSDGQFPNLHTQVITVNKGNKTTIVGSVLGIQAVEKSSGTDTYIIRADNPRENFLSTIDVGSYVDASVENAMLQTISKSINDQNNGMASHTQTAIIINSHSNMATTNRPRIWAEVNNRFAHAGEQLHFKASDEIRFNGYDLSGIPEYSFGNTKYYNRAVKIFEIKNNQLYFYGKISDATKDRVRLAFENAMGNIRGQEVAPKTPYTIQEMESINGGKGRTIEGVKPKTTRFRILKNGVDFKTEKANRSENVEGVDMGMIGGDSGYTLFYDPKADPNDSDVVELNIEAPHWRTVSAPTQAIYKYINDKGELVEVKYFVKNLKGVGYLKPEAVGADFERYPTWVQENQEDVVAESKRQLGLMVREECGNRYDDIDVVARANMLTEAGMYTENYLAVHRLNNVVHNGKKKSIKDLQNEGILSKGKDGDYGKTFIFSQAERVMKINTRVEEVYKHNKEEAVPLLLGGLQTYADITGDSIDFNNPDSISRGFMRYADRFATNIATNIAVLFNTNYVHRFLHSSNISIMGEYMDIISMLKLHVLDKGDELRIKDAGVAVSHVKDVKDSLRSVDRMISAIEKNTGVSIDRSAIRAAILETVSNNLKVKRGTVGGFGTKKDDILSLVSSLL